MDFQTQRLFKTAILLSVFSIVYTILEGLISTYFGLADESLAIFGFGADSFIEAISGFGIVHMITRIIRDSNSQRRNYERTALKITDYSFYAQTKYCSC